jgi:hypothetical protein
MAELSEGEVNLLVYGFLSIVGLVLYFLPLIIARKRQHRQTLAIGALNASLLVIVFVISFGSGGSRAMAYVLTIPALVGSFIWVWLLTWAIQPVQRDDPVQRDRKARTPKQFFGLLAIVASTAASGTGFYIVDQCKSNKSTCWSTGFLA